ncbi:helix-turn-helix domain-containing protein [Aequorivita sp. F47161]|uniref:Helix-turn-helix domain-containing protein n=1 Tax=Aequorivita vitellina TaxID=2874475 RepID=A0A9X1U4A7_9FLAO|nr:helix-turn-helix domain-containing protein [Aequorivita vitellina]MCG2420092.1 helix-turn-helix domain-containing protein [Aequorivita vitellina]
MSKKPKKNRSKDLADIHLLRDEDVMKLFGISRSCLYRWRQKGIIPFKKMGSINFYIKEVIVEMLYRTAGRLPELDGAE